MAPKRRLIAMTGTPLTTPLDSYAYCSLINPNAYASKKLFEATHVKKRDFFDNPVEYKDEEQLNANFLHNSARVFRREVNKDLIEPIYTPIPYELEPSHKKVYDQLAEEALLEISGKEISADTEQKLQIMLQQIIIGYEYLFENQDERVSARKKVKALELLEQLMYELDGRKLIIYAYYQNTIKVLKQFCQKWHAVEIYGGMSDRVRQANLDTFIKNSDCQILIGQPKSMGVGLDNLKTVCADVLFLELPLVANDFTQAVGRVDRNGQTERCHIRVACANGTLQVRRQAALLNKDAVANKIQLTYRDLRDWIFGA